VGERALFHPETVGLEVEELGRLRREVRTLRMERDILKKATAFFAKENE
jgi:transposase-like protein